MIIGVDPGTTTGVSVFDDNMTVMRALSAFKSVDYLWLVLDRVGFKATVACERFDITPQTVRMKRNVDALHVAGALRFKCEQVDATFIEYGRSDAKRFATDDKLRRLGMYSSDSPHKRDASRQIVMHIAGTDPDWLKRGLR